MLSLKPYKTYDFTLLINLIALMDYFDFYVAPCISGHCIVLPSLS